MKQYQVWLESSHGRCATFQTRLVFRPLRSSRERRKDRGKDGWRSRVSFAERGERKTERGSEKEEK